MIKQARDKKYHILYKTVCTTTNKFYIGVHSTDDLEDGYRGSGKRIWHSIKKYGKDVHKVEVLEMCKSRKELLLREKEVVNSKLLEDPLCLNLIEGGNAAPVLSPAKQTEESRRKMSEASKSFWVNLKSNPEALAEHIAKINKPEHIRTRSQANIGKKRTKEALENLSNGQRRYCSEVDVRILRERSLRASETMKIRGTRSGGRPKGTPMSEVRKQIQREIAAKKRKEKETFMTTFVGPRKPANVHKRLESFVRVFRVCCLACHKETTSSALKQFHLQCKTN